MLVLLDFYREPGPWYCCMPGNGERKERKGRAAKMRPDNRPQAEKYEGTVGGCYSPTPPIRPCDVGTQARCRKSCSGGGAIIEPNVQGLVRYSLPAMNVWRSMHTRSALA